MSGFGRVLRTAFRSTIRDPQIRNHEAAKEEIARGVVRRIATGNARLRRGEYLTKKQSDENFERVKGYDFDEQQQ